jgi:hypothetical protein
LRRGRLRAVDPTRPDAGDGLRVLSRRTYG